jgi:hypothetical protein
MEATKKQEKTGRIYLDDKWFIQRYNNPDINFIMHDDDTYGTDELCCHCVSCEAGKNLKCKLQIPTNIKIIAEMYILNI